MMIKKEKMNQAKTNCWSNVIGLSIVSIHKMAAQFLSVDGLT